MSEPIPQPADPAQGAGIQPPSAPAPRPDPEPAAATTAHGWESGPQASPDELLPAESVSFPSAIPMHIPETAGSGSQAASEDARPAPNAADTGAGEPVAAASSGAGAEALLGLALRELQQRRTALEEEIAALERRRDQLQQETARNFSGQSDAIARRIRGFQDYLVGALQDLVVAAEQIDLVPQPVLVQPSPLDRPDEADEAAAAPPAVAGQFSQDEGLIRSLLRRYGGQPDFQADPWKLRRSLEAAGAGLLEDWFLFQGGRGAQPSSGSRNRNVLIAAAAISVLGELYGDRFQTLVLAGQPERLGEWRRGLQDCLGLSREDFGPTSGIVLFERAEALIERADRLEERGELPFIVVDAAERVVEIPLLQFPLWLAFAAGPDELLLEEDLY